MIEVVMDDDRVIKVSPHMTIGQYQKFIKNNDLYKNNPAELLSLYLNISIAELKDLPLAQVKMVESYITNEMAKDFSKDEMYETFEFDGVEYGLENDWGKLSWGAWVDFQVYSSENIEENIHLLMATLYRPVISRDKKGKYKIEKYKSDEIEDRAVQFKDLPILYWFGASGFFLLISTIYINNIKNSLVWMKKMNDLIMKGWEILPKWLKKRLPLDSILLSPTNLRGKISQK
jgi:hypothetical protein